MAKKLYGTDPDQVPTNADLGTMAYQDKDNLAVSKISKTTEVDEVTILVSEGDKTSPASVTNFRVDNSGSNANDAAIAITSGGGGSSYLLLGDNANDDAGFIEYDNVTNSMKFTTAADDHATLDSVGNFQLHDGSFKVGTGGRTRFTGGGFFDDATNGNNTGVMTGGNQVFLSDGTGAATDNTRNIGATNRRVKDIYVGGGVYLGGTGSANKLDDYEFGAWTPTIEDDDGTGVASYVQRHGQYVKIGNLVHVNFYISGTWTTAPGGGGQITGLPFAVYNKNTYPSVQGAIGYAASGSVGELYLYANTNTTELPIGVMGTGALTAANYSTDMSTTNFQMHIGLTYQTSA